MKIMEYRQIKNNAYLAYPRFTTMSLKEKLEFLKNNPYKDDKEKSKIFITTLLVPNDIDFICDLGHGDLTYLAYKYHTRTNVILAKKWEFSKKIYGNYFKELIEKKLLSEQMIKGLKAKDINPSSQEEDDDIDELLEAIFPDACKWYNEVNKQTKTKKIIRDTSIKNEIYQLIK